jgi:hypothetical protein
MDRKHPRAHVELTRAHVELTRAHVELTATRCNADADGTIKVGRRRWRQIQAGADHSAVAWSCYEGERFRVRWEFADGRACISGEDGVECVSTCP